MGVVAEIIASIYSENGGLSEDVVTTLQGLISQQRFTPLNYSVLFMGNTLTLYKTINDEDNTINGDKAEWKNFVNFYGILSNGISQVRLQFAHTDGQHEIVGTVAYDPTDVFSLLFTPISGTLPTNTLSAVNAIIDPMNVTVNSSILNPSAGTRYLILNPIGDPNSSPAVAWAGLSGTNLIAKANDIIEWNGTYWTVAFDSSEPAIQYVQNLTTMVQYQWTGGQWVKSYEGVYQPGEWSLVL